jgi:hypothetical protein
MDSKEVTTEKAIAPLSRPLRLEEMDWDDPSLSKEELDRICESVECASAAEATGELSSKALAKKARLVGYNWFMTLYNPEERLDVSEVLSSNDKRFKYGIWQYFSLKGVLVIRAYIEGKSNLSIGTLRRLFSNYGDAQFVMRKCTREQAFAHCLKEDGRVRGPYSFGKLNHGSRKRASEGIMEMLSKFSGSSGEADNIEGQNKVK